MLGKDPAFLFYSGDFLSGTYSLRDVDIGKLVRLLCMQHQGGHLKEREVLRVVRRLDAPATAFFVRDADGLFYNERLDREIIRRREYTASRLRNFEGRKNSSLSSPAGGGHMGGDMPAHIRTGTETGTETENRTENRTEDRTENMTGTGPSFETKSARAKRPADRRTAAAPTSDGIDSMRRLIEKMDTAN